LSFGPGVATWTREELGKRTSIERFFGHAFLFFHLNDPVLATWDMRSTLRQEIVEEKCIAISSLGRWQRKRTETAIFDAPFSNGYPT
jgi:hypothetical protein